MTIQWKGSCGWIRHFIGIACLGLAMLCPGAPSLAQATAQNQEPLVVTRYQSQPGTVHADFVLPRIEDGQPQRLSDLRGKKVLLVHFASW